MDVDLLVNPAISGTATLETVDIPTIDFNDMAAPPSAEAPPPKLVPSLEETGPIRLDGFDNFNAESCASSSVSPSLVSRCASGSPSTAPSRR